MLPSFRNAERFTWLICHTRFHDHDDNVDVDADADADDGDASTHFYLINTIKRL